MDKSTATLIAAGIAAFISLINLLVKLSADSNSEIRAAHRIILQPHLEDLGKHLHEIMASSSTLLKTKSDTSRKAWTARANETQSHLKDLRCKVRYPLWGLDEGFRVLTRLPNWVSHHKKYPEQAEELLMKADKTRIAIEEAIRNSYEEGRPPSWKESKRVQRRAASLRKMFTRHKKERTSAWSRLTNP